MQRSHRDDLQTASAYPLPYSTPCDTFRPLRRQTAAPRTESGCETFVDLFIPGAMLDSLVCQYFFSGRNEHARIMRIFYCMFIQFVRIAKEKGSKKRGREGARLTSPPFSTGFLAQT